MEAKKLTPNQIAFLKNPKGNCAVWLEVSMNQARASYSTVGIALGITRDALYKKANPELPNNNITLAEAAQQMLELDDLTLLFQLADLLDMEVVPKGTMAKIKALPDAFKSPNQDDSYPLYQQSRQVRRPLLKAMMEEAVDR